ncbi:MAG TPA: hypothetical protein VFG09_06065 [Thermodesulfovibrionales bacterium]|jgi:hypothetical protein|nr:hypothetical protein [Thermodesulfovibrionales bacterium]
MKKALLAVIIVLIFSQTSFAGTVYNFEFIGGGPAWGDPSYGKSGYTDGTLIYKNGSTSVEMGHAFMTYFQIESGNQTINHCVIDVTLGDAKFRFQTYSAGLFAFSGNLPSQLLLFGDLTCDPGGTPLPGGGGVTPSSFSFELR